MPTDEVDYRAQLWRSLRELLLIAQGAALVEARRALKNEGLTGWAEWHRVARGLSDAYEAVAPLTRPDIAQTPPEASTASTDPLVRDQLTMEGL